MGNAWPTGVSDGGKQATQHGQIVSFSIWDRRRQVKPMAWTAN
jgi:hypothetical protein